MVHPGSLLESNSNRSHYLKLVVVRRDVGLLVRLHRWCTIGCTRFQTMNIFIEEIGTTPNSTASQLFIDGKPFCFVVEDGHRDKKVASETRIPPGRYQVVKRTEGRFYEKYKADFKHQFALHIINVPGFEYILLHIGNTIKDTKGCLLVNRNIGINPITGNYQGTDSSSVYRALYMIVAAAFERGEECWIEIQRREIIDENTPVG
jgi:hypothetical protein